MPFSTEWEQLYGRGVQNSIWPWSDLVSYVMRYARPTTPGCRVLEIGFGAGANVAFFASLGVEYFGLEGSASATQRVRERFAQTPRVNLQCCDFTTLLPVAGPFDLIVDRSSLTHNGTAAIQATLSGLGQLLRPGGKFIGIDWFSTEHAEFSSGRPLEDDYTRTAFQAGQFQGVGTVHFSDAAHLAQLVKHAGLELERLEHKRSEICIPAGASTMAWWNFVAVRR
jgi:SAM-dependent methyltransferase